MRLARVVATLLAVAGGGALAGACGGDAPRGGGPGGAPEVGSPATAAVRLPRDPPLVIAHRGASASAPEHTFAAWDSALASADYLEQDLQLTRDSVLVVLHDETLDRTASGPGCEGPVRERTLEELRPCEVGGWFGPAWTGAPIPTLDSVLTRYGGRARFYIETKAPGAAPGMEAALVGLLRDHGLLPVGPDRRVIVQSFSEASLRRTATLAPSLPLVQLVSGRASEADLWRRLPVAAEYAVGIGPSAEDVTPELVAAAHARCLEVHPYTVNEAREMVRLLEAGVDGIFTDRPDLLREVVERGVARPESLAPCTPGRVARR